MPFSTNNQNLIINCATKLNKKSSQQGLPEGWTRATFILKQSHIEKLKSIAYWERTTIKELIDEAVSKYLTERDFSSVDK